MFKLDSEDALLKSFRPKDRKSVELPPGAQFPLVVRDYLSWTHPAGGRVFLVFAVPGGVPTGISFDTNGGSGGVVPVMCDWCHMSGAGTQVGLLAAQLSAKKKVGVYVCTDLGCKGKLEDAANLSGRSVLPAIAQLIERMGRFATDALKIDLSGAGR
jgi:hypothetical protein